MPLLIVSCFCMAQAHNFAPVKTCKMVFIGTLQNTLTWAALTITFNKADYLHIDLSDYEAIVA